MWWNLIFLANQIFRFCLSAWINGIYGKPIFWTLGISKNPLTPWKYRFPPLHPVLNLHSFRNSRMLPRWESVCWGVSWFLVSLFQSFKDLPKFDFMCVDRYWSHIQDFQDLFRQTLGIFGPRLFGTNQNKNIGFPAFGNLQT